MQYKSPQDYLKSEYLRLSSLKNRSEPFDLDSYFINAKQKYGSNIEQYEHDKILFKELKTLADELNVPIKEQDKGSYWILNRHSQNIIETLNEYNIKTNKEIVLGTLPTHSLNAYACGFSNEKMLIVFNDGLLMFLYLMGRIVSPLITKKNVGGTDFTLHRDINLVDDILAKNKMSLLKFYETIFLYKNNDLSKSKIYYETDVNKGLSCCLYDTAELFVTSHEYAHVLLGHLFNKKTEKSNKYKFMFNKTLTNWQDEIAADISAYNITLAYNIKKGYGSYGAFLGIEFLFSCLNLIEKIENIKFSETHPQAIYRIEVIRDYFKKSNIKNANHIIKDSEIISLFFEKLWNYYEKDILKNN